MKREAPPTGSVIIALIYTRVSSDEQAREGLSLPTQLTECRRYAAPMPGWVLGGEYQDVLSGTRDDRPDYRRLLEDVRRLRAEGRSVAVVVAALDRFGRAILERVRSREELKALGVPTHSVREGGEVSDLVANVLAAVAEEEVRRLGERVSASRRHIAATGWRASTRPPWGYRWRSATAEERAAGAPRSVVEPDALTAPYVRELFDRVARGESVRGSARWVVSLPDACRGGRAFHYSSVRRVLTSALYIARVQQADGDPLLWPTGHWSALVPDGTWLQVQQRIASHAQMPRQASGRHLLSGLLRCPNCGGRMVVTTRPGRRPRYRCTAKASGATAPSRTCLWSVIAPLLDAAVLAEVASLVLVATSTNRELQQSLQVAWRELEQPVSDDRIQCVKTLERRAAQARERLTTAATLLVDGALDKAGYELLRDRARAELEAAEAEIARLRRPEGTPNLPPLDEVLAQAGGWARMLQDANVSEMRQVLGAVVAKVVPLRTGWAEYRGQITWTPLGAALREAAASLSPELAA